MRLSLVLVLGACGFHPGASRDGAAPGEPLPPGPEAGGSDSGTVTASCVANWFGSNLHFTPRRHLDALATTFTERDPSLSHNELQIWFQSNRGGSGALGGIDVFTATRTTTSDPFGTPVPFTDASSPQDDGKYAITDDELSYAISSNRTGTNGGYDIWISHRDSGGQNFPAADNSKLAPNVDDATDQYDPWINNGATRLYYSPIAGGQRIMMASRPNTTAAFGPPVTLTELGNGVPTADPTLFDDELVIVFSSVRSENAGNATNTDLWYATRADPSQPFDAPQHILDLATSNFEGDPWVSANGCHLYFAAENGGDYDLYESDVVP